MLVLLSLLAQLAWGESPFILRGNVPVSVVPDLQARMERVWHHVAYEFGGSTLGAPEIYFFEFDRAEEASDWIEFQNEWLTRQMDVWRDWRRLRGESPDVVTPLWVRENVGMTLPFPRDFVGLYYVGTNRLQLSPRATFLRHVSRGPSGLPQDFVGIGYYYAAHEMLHYVLAERGVPVQLHHCLFVTPTETTGAPMQRLAEYLMSERLSSPLARITGFGGETRMNPCGELSARQRAEVAGWALQLTSPLGAAHHE